MPCRDPSAQQPADRQPAAAGRAVRRLRAGGPRAGKILRFGRTRTLVAIDVYNLFNANLASTFSRPSLERRPDLVQPADAADAALRALQRDGRLLIRAAGVTASSGTSGRAFLGARPFPAYASMLIRSSPRGCWLPIDGSCGASCRDSDRVNDVHRRQRAADGSRSARKAAGIDFVHFNGMSGERYYPEIMAPGVGCSTTTTTAISTSTWFRARCSGRARRSRTPILRQGPLKDRLYRNDLGWCRRQADAALHGRHRPERHRHPDLRHGCRAGRYRQRRLRRHLSHRSHRERLLHNNGNGTFTDVTAKTGTANKGGWGVSAAFVDIDRDGWLDLFVGNYLLYTSKATSTACPSPGSTTTVRRTATARSRPPVSQSRQRHVRRRDRAALIGGAYGPALGVSTADFNNDGWIDIYVGNDGMPNQLWINQKNGTFKDMAFLNGAAVNGQGNSEASMGIDAGDFDNDGDEDLFITNWLAQMNILYLNTGTASSRIARRRRDSARRAWPRPVFGTPGSTSTTTRGSTSSRSTAASRSIEAQARANDPFPVEDAQPVVPQPGQRPVRGRLGARWRAVHAARRQPGRRRLATSTTTAMRMSWSGRRGPDASVHQQRRQRNHWLGLRLIGVGGRDMLGARVSAVRPSGPDALAARASDGSYASANDPRVLVGLGTSTAIQ